MPSGNAVVFHVSSSNDYAYTWRTDANPPGEFTSVVTGKTKQQAFTEVAQLLNALPGALVKVNISGESVSP